jgi:hypothetical protein
MKINYPKIGLWMILIETVILMLLIPLVVLL